jgi:hypothetical protein
MPQQPGPASHRFSQTQAHKSQFVLQPFVYNHGHRQGWQASLSRSLASTPNDISSSSGSNSSGIKDDGFGPNDGGSDSDDSGSDSDDSGSDSDEEEDHWEQYREVNKKDDDDRDDLDSAIPEERRALPTAVREEAGKAAAANLPKEVGGDGKVLEDGGVQDQARMDREQADTRRADRENRPAFAADGSRCVFEASASYCLASLAAGHSGHALPDAASVVVG